MTADSDPPLASEAPASLRRPTGPTLVGRLLVTVVLMLGCVSGGQIMASVDASHLAESVTPSALDEVPAAIGAPSSFRRRVSVTRRRFCRVVRRVLRGDDRRRFAHWLLPAQFRLMPPAWRGPTVLRV